MIKLSTVSLALIATLAGCGVASTQRSVIQTGTSCPQMDQQAQSVMVSTASMPVRCGPQQGTVIASGATAQRDIATPTQLTPPQVMPAAQPIGVAQPLVIVPNQSGPAIIGQVTQAEAELLAAQGIPVTQENIDFIRLALQ